MSIAQTSDQVSHMMEMGGVLDGQSPVLGRWRWRERVGDAREASRVNPRTSIGPWLTTRRRQKCRMTIEEGDIVGQDCCGAQKRTDGDITTLRSIYRAGVLTIKE